jgi:acyl dehydratase
MALPGVHLGVQQGPYETWLDPELIRRFAEATRDPSGRARSGESMPPVAMITQSWDPMVHGRDHIIDQDLRHSAPGGAHGQHDTVLHRPLRPGERLRTWVDGWGSRPAGRNALCTLHLPTYDDSDVLVAEQWWSFIYMDTTCETVGRPLPDHAFPTDARQRHVGAYDIEMDEGLPRRYAEVTNDWARLHFDLEASLANGFPGLTAHGLSTLALCSQGIVDQFAGGDPDRVRRLAGRFSAPALLGHELHVDIYEVADGVYAFEATCAGARVISHGRMELRTGR